MIALPCQGTGFSTGSLCLFFIQAFKYNTLVRGLNGETFCTFTFVPEE